MSSLILDCDGVLADTERTGHLVAFNAMYDELGVPVHWSDEQYAELLKIGGGKERMRTVLTPEFVAAQGYPADPAGQDELIATWHRRKTSIYTERVDRGDLPARPGIARLVGEAYAAGWSLAVASTSAEASVRAVLVHAVGADLAQHVLVLAGDIVPHKKPAPDIYLLALERLGTSAEDAIVVEDSGNGVAAAVAAGLRTLVTVSAYTGRDDFTGAVLVVPDLDHGPDGPITVSTLAALLAAPQPKGARR